MDIGPSVWVRADLDLQSIDVPKLGGGCVGVQKVVYAE